MLQHRCSLKLPSIRACAGVVWGNDTTPPTDIMRSDLRVGHLQSTVVFKYDAVVQCVHAAAATGGSIHQSTARGGQRRLQTRYVCMQHVELARALVHGAFNISKSVYFRHNCGSSSGAASN